MADRSRPAGADAGTAGLDAARQRIDRPAAASPEAPIVFLVAGSSGLLQRHAANARAAPAAATHFMIDRSTCPAVERDPGVVSGAWVFRGTRVPVAALFENPEDGATVHDFLEWFPGVTSEQVRTVLDQAARSALATAQVRVLFDRGTPAPLRAALTGHVIETAYELGWSTLRDGELIAAAEKAGFEDFVASDRNLEYQQNLTHRSLAIVVLGTTSWSRLQRLLPTSVQAVNSASAGSYLEVKVEGTG